MTSLNAYHPWERLGGDEDLAMIIERAFGVLSVTHSRLADEASRTRTGSVSM